MALLLSILPIIGVIGGILLLGLLIVMVTFRFNPISRLILFLRGVRVQARVISIVGLNLNPRSMINIFDLELELLGDFAGKRVSGRVVGPRHGVLNGQLIWIVLDPSKESRFRVDWKSAKQPFDDLARGDLSSFLQNVGKPGAIQSGPPIQSGDRISKL